VAGAKRSVPRLRSPADPGGTLRFAPATLTQESREVITRPFLRVDKNHRRPFPPRLKVTDEDNVIAHTRRRLPRLSVRALIVVVMVIGGGVGWFIRSVRIQRQAVEAIEKVGGVRYNWLWQSDAAASRLKPWTGEWVVNRIGPDYFGHVTSVEIMSHVTSDLEMRHIGNLPKLELLRLYDVRTSEAALSKLAGLHELRILVMIGPAVTDFALAQVPGMTRLEALDLLDCGITDAGLRHLEGLRNLQELEIGRNASVSGAGVIHLRGLMSLRKLFLDYLPVTDDGLVHLRGLTNLEMLYLTKTRVTDAGLENLKGMTRLTQLELSECDITDAGIRHLKVMTSLKNLMLINTKVTDAGAEDLKRALPNVKIFR
jgi:Leucine Rich repeat